MGAFTDSRGLAREVLAGCVYSLPIHVHRKSTPNKINGNLMRVCSSDLARFGADMPFLFATFLLSSFFSAISCVNLINFLAISCSAVCPSVCFKLPVGRHLEKDSPLDREFLISSCCQKGKHTKFGSNEMFARHLRHSRIRSDMAEAPVRSGTRLCPEAHSAGKSTSTSGQSTARRLD